VLIGFVQVVRRLYFVIYFELFYVVGLLLIELELVGLLVKFLLLWLGYLRVLSSYICGGQMRRKYLLSCQDMGCANYDFEDH
jgi:hypothetical protein